MSSPLLEVKNLSIRFGGLKAVDNLTFTLNKGDLAGMIGPNGAGKTTAFNLMTGVYQPTSGELLLKGKSILGLKPFEICRKGIARTFQNIRLFKSMSVLENVLVPALQNVQYSDIDCVFQTEKYFKAEKAVHEKCLHLLDIFNLGKKADEEASSLPYGEQRKLEIIRTLATDPDLILLDEPAAGMNHSETHSLMETVARIRKEFNLTVLLIEHDMKLVMGLCEKIVVLDHGVKIDEGNPARIRSSKQVIEAYLGVEVEA